MMILMISALLETIGKMGKWGKMILFKSEEYLLSVSFGEGGN